MLDGLLSQDLRDLVRQVNERCLAGSTAFRAWPDLEAVPKQYWEANRDLYLDTIIKNRSGVSPKGLADIESAKTVHQAMSQFDAAVRDSKIDLAKTFDNRFTDKAWQTIARKS